MKEVTLQRFTRYVGQIASLNNVAPEMAATSFCSGIPVAKPTPAETSRSASKGWSFTFDTIKATSARTLSSATRSRDRSSGFMTGE